MVPVPVRVDNIFIISYKSSSSTWSASSISLIQIEQGLFMSTKLPSCMNLDVLGDLVVKLYTFLGDLVVKLYTFLS